jgi:hypothetical protein
MIKRIKSIFVFTLLLLSGLAHATGGGGSDEISEKAFALLKQAIESNQENDRLGFAYRNRYVIEVDLNKDWIEERGAGEKVLQSKYAVIREKLVQFNSSRPDKLRAYVIVVNDWSLRLKQHVDLGLLPATVNFNDLSKQAETNQVTEKSRIENEMSSVPYGIKAALQKEGYTDIAVYFGASLLFYTTQNDQPVKKKYKYSSLLLAGSRLLDKEQELRSKFPSAVGLQLENQIELSVIALTDGIKELVDQQVPFALSNKVANSNVNSWYPALGAKTIDPFSGTSTDQQVYDYTGVFISRKQDIINLLPDPTAKIIFTDNLTPGAIITNIKSQVAKPLIANVFWFHLDRKGELHTELFLAESVKQRLVQVPNNVAENLQAYIGKLYKDGGPKIKSPADLVDFLNIEAHMFRALNKVIANLRIPTEWYDASHPDYLLGIYGRFISPESGLAFAYVCGLWNGIIDNLSLVGMLLSLKSELQGVFFKVLVDDQYRTELFDDIRFYCNNIGTLLELGYEMVKAEISASVQREWEKLKNGVVTAVAYVAGMATIEVLITIVTAGAAEAAKAGLMSIRLIRVPVEFITKVGNAMIKPVAYIFKAGGKILLQGAEFVLKQGDEIIAKLTAEGKLIVYKLLGEAETLVDEIPLPQSMVLTDASGNTLQEVVLARTATGWGFKKRSDFLEALSKSLTNYSALRTKALALSRDLQEKFVDDFLKNADDNILRQLNGNPTLVDAWEVLNIDAALRKNPADLEKLSKFMKETGVEKSRLISSFGNAKDAQKWIDMKIPEGELNSIYDGIKGSPLDDLTPWTPEHKAQAWANYKSGNLDADFKTWSNQYDGNIKKASSASSGVDEYYNALGWNCTNCKEVTTKDITILTDDGLQTFSRRHDIADKSSNVKKAVEVKEYYSGKVYYSEKSIKTQVALDAALLESREFFSIEWVFKGCEPSKPLEDALRQAGITIKKIL